MIYAFVSSLYGAVKHIQDCLVLYREWVFLSFVLIADFMNSIVKPAFLWSPTAERLYAVD